MRLLGQKFISISLGLSQKKQNLKVATYNFGSVYIQNNFTGLLLIMPSSKIAQIVPVH